VTSPLPAFLVAFVSTLGLVRLLLVPAVARLVLDIPNDRSLHVAPTPRTGGVGLLLGAAASWLVFGGGLAATAGIAAALALVFFFDDISGLPVPVRFGMQAAAAILFVYAMDLQPLLLAPLFVVGIVWCMNLYNFMDGSNGLAGGMTLFGFGAYAIAAQAAGANDLALVGAVIAGAALGFLGWNFDPARVFLGDAGSIPLGFLAAALGLLGWQRDVWPFWFPLLVFSPFITDATLTLMRRALRGEKVWQAHKSHYYQRLVRMGWSHRKLARAEYALMAAACASALLSRNAEPAAAIALIAVWILIYAVIMRAIDLRWAALGYRAAG
jgi:UDP-N-acetylmuramyl pentapeptide phosphotransferase/UDP-N-acetylglucosamine-1-phosphate transferase